MHVVKSTGSVGFSILYPSLNYVWTFINYTSHFLITFVFKPACLKDFVCFRAWTKTTFYFITLRTYPHYLGYSFCFGFTHFFNSRFILFSFAIIFAWFDLIIRPLHYTGSYSSDMQQQCYNLHDPERNPRFHIAGIYQ